MAGLDIRVTVCDESMAAFALNQAIYKAEQLSRDNKSSKPEMVKGRRYASAYICRSNPQYGIVSWTEPGTSGFEIEVEVLEMDDFISLVNNVLNPRFNFNMHVEKVTTRTGESYRVYHDTESQPLKPQRGMMSVMQRCRDYLFGK